MSNQFRVPRPSSLAPVPGDQCTGQEAVNVFCIIMPKLNRWEERLTLCAGQWGAIMEQRTSPHGGEGEEEKQREPEREPVVVGFPSPTPPPRSTL